MEEFSFYIQSIFFSFSTMSVPSLLILCILSISTLLSYDFFYSFMHICFILDAHFSMSAHFSLSHSTCACLHFFLISVFNVLYSLPFYEIFFCFIFTIFRISSVVPTFFSIISLSSLKLLLMFHFEFPVLFN